MRNYANNVAATSLNGSVNASVTTWTVYDGSTYPATPFTAKCESEVVLVTAKSGTLDVTWTVTRGYDGTTAATHATSTEVTDAVIAADLNQLWYSPADKPPDTADTFDDEFDATLSGWTWDNQSTATAATTNGQLKFTCPVQSGHQRHLYKSISGSYKITAKFAGMTTGNYGYNGLVFIRSGGPNFEAFGFVQDSGLLLRSWRGTNTTTGLTSEATVDWANSSGPLYIEMEHDGTDLVRRYSVDCKNWFEFSTETLASQLGGSPDRAGFTWNISTGSAKESYWEWIRGQWTLGD